MAVGTTIDPYPDEEALHRAITEWWVRTVSGASTDAPLVAPVPVLSPSGGEDDAHPTDQPARGVLMHAEQDRLTVRSDEAGWTWLRVSWDPDWRSVNGTAVRKGGPGHLLVWAERGTTELRWSVPGPIDAAAAAATGVAVLAAAAMAAVNRSRASRPIPTVPSPRPTPSTSSPTLSTHGRTPQLGPCGEESPAFVAVNNAVEGVVSVWRLCVLFPRFQSAPIDKGQHHRVCSHRRIPSRTCRCRDGMSWLFGEEPSASWPMLAVLPYRR